MGDTAFLLYNEGTDQPGGNIGLDLLNLLKYINGVTRGLGIDGVLVDSITVRSIIAGMRQDFPYENGFAGASPFKMVANFMAYFIAEKPIVEPFPEEALGEIYEIQNHQNAIIALCVGIECLHGAIIHQDEGDNKILENRIVLSRHSLCDIVEAISNITPRDHFKILSVLLEQLAYKENPECQYSNIVSI